MAKQLLYTDDARKKLLAGGEQRIVEFAKVFRNRERTPLHHPEFTLVEWYRAGEPYGVLMDDCVAILGEAARVAGVRQFNYRGRSSDPFAEPERLTVAEAFARQTGWQLTLGDWTASERQQIEELTGTRYRNEAWNAKR